MIKSSRVGRAASLWAIFVVGSGLGVAAQDSAAAGEGGSLGVRSPAPIPLTRVSGGIVLDGLPDDAAWQNVPLLPITQYAPVFRGPLTEETQIQVAYDESYLYVAGRMYDSDPGGVRSVTLSRDQYRGDDLFSVVLDTFNDNESALWFTASPSGVRSDRSVSNDGEWTNGPAMNDNWNAHWDLATAWTEEGWFAEMRIPFSSLGFQDDDGHVEMGLIAYRFIARKNERQTFPEIPPNWGMGFAKPSQAQRVTMEGVYASKPAYITPYVLGGVAQSAELNVAETGYDVTNDRITEAGLDLKYNVTNNLTLDVTLNPDFGQVEADSLQVNLTRFSLFFPEKRQFFQERSGLFAFNTGGISRLFNSRQIGLNPVGDPVRIYGGVRLVGRLGSTDFGFLNMQTASQDLMPSENSGVARLRRQVFNPFSTIGGMLTTRADMDGDWGVTAGIDTSVRVFGDEYVILKWASTFEKEDGDSPTGTLLDASRILARWERRNEVGFSYSLEYVHSGQRYLPRLGFVLRNDFSNLRNGLQYQWFQGATSILRTIKLANEAFLYRRGTLGTVESGAINPSLEFETKTGRSLTLTLENNYESVLETFFLSGVTPVVPGEYWFHQGAARLDLGRNALLRGGLSVRAGSFYDGWLAGFGGGPTLSMSRHFEIGAGYELNAIRFPDRDEELNAHLVSFKVQAALDIHFSAAALLQYNSTVDQVNANIRFRYHFREGSDLWLVYNDAVNTERDILGRPQLPFSQGRNLMLKYTYTFIR
jgi:hypothetical protein